MYKINKIEKNMYNNKKIYLTVFFGLYLLLGLLIVKDYGISYDEPYQRNHGLVTEKYIASLIVGEENIPERLKTVEDLNEYQNKNYGIAIKIPILIWEYFSIDKIENQDYYLLWHIYVFLWFWIASICFYKISIKLGFNNKFSFIGLLLFILCPRIFADSFYNIKDSLFLSLFLINIYYLLVFFERQNIKNIFKLAVISAFCINTRFIGAILLFLAVFFLLKRIINKEISIYKIIALLGTCFVIYIIVSPASWHNPIKYCYDVVMNFSDFPADVTYNIFGTIYQASSLPWFYLIIAIVITTPLIYSIYSLYGIGVLLLDAVKTKKYFTNQIFLLCILIFVVLTDAILRPTKYNMWRHFYFIFPLLVFSMMYGIKNLIKKNTYIKYIVYVSLIGTILHTSIWMMKNHPYEYLYYNSILGDDVISDANNDYWRVSTRGLIDKIKEDRNLNIYAVPDSNNCFFGERNWENYHLANTSILAEYTTWGNNSILYEKIDGVEIDGYNSNSSLYKRKNYDNCIQRLQINYNKSMVEEGGLLVLRGEGELLIELPDNFNVKQVDLVPSQNGSLMDISVMVSDDSEHWMHLSNDYKKYIDKGYWTDQIVGIVSERKLPKYVKVQFKEMEATDFDLRIYGEEKSIKNSKVSKVTANYNEAEIEKLLDNDIVTRWSSNRSQNTDIQVDIILKDLMKVKNIVLDNGISSCDYPEELQIYGKKVDGTWNKVKYITRDNKKYILQEPDYYSEFKLNPGKNKQFYWSIYEIEIEEDIDYEWDTKFTRDTICELQTNYSNASLSYILDNDIRTIWSTNLNQTKDMFLEFQVSAPVWLNGIHLDDGAVMESTRNLVIFGSYDGVSWTKIDWNYASANDYIFNELVDFSFYKLEQQGEDDKYSWSIAELGLLTD